MHSLLAVDGRGEPLSKVSTWADTRAGKQAAWLTGRYDAQELYQRTGCCVRHPFYPLSKVLWLRENEPEVWGKTAKLITLKEYILYKLFGEYVVDYTLASSQGYFNLHSLRWDEDVTAGVLELSRGVLSEPVPCTHLLQGMGEEYASLMGVDRMLPVAVGSGDGILANLAAASWTATPFPPPSAPAARCARRCAPPCSIPIPALGATPSAGICGWLGAQ